MNQIIFSVLTAMLGAVAIYMLLLSQRQDRAFRERLREDMLEAWYRYRLADRDHMCRVGEQLRRERVWTLHVDELPSRWAYAQVVTRQVYGDDTSNYTHVMLPRLKPLAWQDETGVQHAVAWLYHPDAAPPPAMRVYVLACATDTRVFEPKADAFVSCLACFAQRNNVG